MGHKVFECLQFYSGIHKQYRPTQCPFSFPQNAFTTGPSFFPSFCFFFFPPQKLVNYIAHSQLQEEQNLHIYNRISKLLKKTLKLKPYMSCLSQHQTWMRVKH